MGQQCCSASQNTPQIVVQREDSCDQGDKKQQTNTLAKLQQEQNKQKLSFYGKNGDQHSKTRTSQMCNALDNKLQQYKKQIFQKPIAIIQETQEDDEQIPKKPSSKDLKSSKQKTKKDIDNYLQQLAEDVSKNK